MTITLTPELEAAIVQEAHRDGKTPETVVVEAVRLMLDQKVRWITQDHPELVPRDDWERLVLGIGTDAGVSMTDEQLSREVMYEDHD